MEVFIVILRFIKIIYIYIKLNVIIYFIDIFFKVFIDYISFDWKLYLLVFFYNLNENILFL